MELSTLDIIAAGIAAVALILAFTARRSGMRQAFTVAQEMANREADIARVMAVSARKGGFYDVSLNLDAQADALRSLALQLDYRMASSFLKKDPQEEGADVVGGGDGER